MAATTEPAAGVRQLSCQVNGEQVQLDLPNEDGLTLLDVLRDFLGITSPKNGCQPQAQCGCCTVLMDGKPVLSCALSPAKAEGKSITTLEGLDEEHRQQISESFVRCGGVQCGFCIPGMAMRGVGLCDKNAEPEPRRDRDWRSSRICAAARATRRSSTASSNTPSCAAANRCRSRSAADKSGRIGTDLPRYTGHDAVLGDRKFIDDMVVPNMLYGAVRLTDHPRAKVLRIDATPRAGARWRPPRGHRRRCAGRSLRRTHRKRLARLRRDRRRNTLQRRHHRQRCRRHAAARSQGGRADRHRIRSAGTGDIPQAALEPGAPLIHPKRGTNLLSKSKLKRGDVEEGFRKSAHIIEDSYRTQRIEHLFLEPESCIAIPVDDASLSFDELREAWKHNGHSTAGYPLKATPNGERRMFIYTQGQGVFDDQRQCASVLGIDRDRVQTELVSNGGAFGGKEDMSIQAQTTLMAWLVGRPVKVTLTRPESFQIHPKRHPIDLTYKIGCDAEGHITAVQARIVGDKGAYASVGAKVLERAGGHCTGPYRVPAIDMESLAVYTNNPPCGAMRGFGANQSAFAIENLLDRLAEKVGIDAYDIRDRNILEPGETFATGQILDKPFGLRKTLEAVKDAFKSAKYAGIACGIKNCGIGNGMPDIGKSAFYIAGRRRRSTSTPASPKWARACSRSASSSRSRPPICRPKFSRRFRPTRNSCSTAAKPRPAGRPSSPATRSPKPASNSRPNSRAGKTLADLVGQTFIGEWSCTYTSKLGYDLDKPGGPKTHISYGFATQLAILDDDGKLVKMIAAHDVGRVLNPVQLKGQMYGSLHMGIGYALTEDFQAENGVILAKKMNDCGVLRSHQMPEMELIFVEEPDPECPHGARGVGEIGLVPTAPCIAGALYKYDGIVRNELPMRDSPAALAITKPNVRRK